MTLETRRELSIRYMQELSELLHEHEISSAVADQLIRDLFEPEEPGEPRRVRTAVWQAYLKDRTGHVGPHLVHDIHSEKGRAG